MNIKIYIAEALGTFTLTLAVALSLAGSFPLATPILAALVLGLFVYTIGHVSGTHINPAVTIGAWSIGKIATLPAVFYIIAQFVGATLALVLAKSMLTPLALVVSDTSRIALAEAIGMALFTFGIASMVYGKTPGTLSGVVVGTSLLGGIALASLLGSNGVLNPAVALGIGSFNLMYIAGPILGSVIGMQLYKILATK